MPEEEKVQPQQKQKAAGEESLLPQEERIFSPVSWLAAWIGSSIFIGVFMLGGSLVPPTGKMNLFQAIICMLVALSIVAVCLMINGRAGNKYGIPFVAQARTSFGYKGSIFPMCLRAIPAICWYGIQSWVGATALCQVLDILFGIGTEFPAQLACFVVFQGIQIWMSAGGFHGIKWIENIGTVVIVVSLIYMLYVLIANFGDALSAGLINIEGTWGLPFFVGTTVFVGMFTTWMLNASDYTREVVKFEKPKSRITLIIWLGTVPPVVLMGAIGLMAANITGQWDPVVLFVETLPNSFVLIVALIFIAVAQITTNVMANVIPPTFVIMELFKLKYKTASVIVGVIALFTFPWWLSSATGFTMFITFYSAFLGPIFAVMVTDYYFVRKQELDLTTLYNPKGPYAGVNWCGIAAIIVGAACGFIYTDLGWYISLIPSALTYYLLMKSHVKKGGPFAADAKMK